MSRLLVTGGFGYLGGRLALALRRQWPEAEVLLGARPGTARPAWASDFAVTRMTLGDWPVPPDALEGVELLVHLAALNEHRCHVAPLEAMRVNVLGTHQLLDAAADAGVQRVVYVSTFHVYAKAAGGRIHEGSPTRSSHPYSYSHRAAEDVVDHFRDRHGIEGLVLRLSNAFGAPAGPEANRWTLLFNDLCRQAVTTGRLVLNSSGLQHRDFIPMSDATSAIIHMARNPHLWDDGLYNLGSGSSLSVLDAAESVARVQAEMTGNPPLPVETRAGAGSEAVAPFIYDISKLARAGFVPKADMDHELRGCLEFCKEHFRDAERRERHLEA